MAGPVLRVHHVRTVEDFLAEVPLGTRGLVLEGEAGIGKTTLAEAGVDRARAAGFRVAVARVGQADTSLSYAALGDLFDAIPDTVFDRLPAPQRAALDVALLRTDGDGAARDARAVCVATLAAVRRLASERPLIMVIDDLQWLDPSSARVIGFVLKRLGTEPVGVLATRRVDDTVDPVLDLAHSLPPRRLRRVVLGPLSLGDFGHVVREGSGAILPRSVVVKLHEMVEGNPFYGQEMAREVVRRGRPEPGAPFPVPGDAFRVVERRARSLPEGTRMVLAAVALASRATVDLIRKVLPNFDIDEAVFGAEAAGLLTMRHGRLSFSHPLFASAIVATTAAPDLRDLHARLAAALEAPEEHARHLALSATGADSAIAAALDRACRSARARGASMAAAEFAELALAHATEEDADDRTRRRVSLALLAFEAGDAERSDEVFCEVLAAMPSGPERAHVLVRQCEISWQDTLAVESLATRAIKDAGADNPVSATCAHIELAWVRVYRGDLAKATEHVAAARAAGADLDDPAVRTDLLTIDSLVSFLRGEPFDELLNEAVDLENLIDQSGPADGSTIYSSARVVRGLISMWAGDLERCRPMLLEELAEHEARGRYVARDEVLGYLAHVGCRDGRWDLAADHANECLDIGEESGHRRGRGQNLLPRAWLAALRGDLGTARRDASEGLGISLGYGDLLAAAGCRTVLGFVELSDSSPQAAVEHFLPSVAFLRGLGTAEPGLVPCVADAVTALVATGRLDEASAIVADDRLMGRCSSLPHTEAVSSRGTAALLAARGDLDGAVDLLEQLLGSLALEHRPFERARVLQLVGEVERRRRRRAQARDRIEAARALFDRLGARRWADLASAQLCRLAPAPAISELSPADLRLVELVVKGLTNREAAGQLFVSVKTVEANLSRIYRRTGVRSRTELVGAIADGHSTTLGAESSEI